MKKYDLHIHSTCSDGTASPKELIIMAKEKGLAGISITDHDTVSAYSEETMTFAKSQGIELITGIECSSHFDRFGVHILGYNIDPKSPELVEFCEKHQKRRKERNKEILALLFRANMIISEEELYQENQKQTVGRPHIAALMIEKGYVKDISEAFQKYLGEDKSCFAPGTRISIEETIGVIHRAGGLAFLAHPILYKRKNLMKKLLSFDFDGMECYYAKFPKDRVQRFLDLASEYDLLVSGGSDYHGEVKPYNSMGSSFTPEEAYKQMLLKQ